MYCGSCLRDNALAAELLARGHDVVLVPLYTPTRTDEPNVSRPRVFFGGISVYLQQHFAFFRRTPRFLDRLWDSPAVIRAFAARSASTDPRLLGDLTVSMLEGDRGLLRKEFEKLLDWLAGEPTPDIVNLPNSLLIGLARPLRQTLRRPVCCTLQGEELFLQGLPEPSRGRAMELIRQQVPYVDRFIAVSESCAEFMGRYLGIPATRMAVVPLGINLAGYESRSFLDPKTPASGPEGDLFRVGYFARVAPEKGLHLLADAYQRLRRRIGGGRLRLDAAGYLAPAHEPYLKQVHRALTAAGLGEEFTYRGALDREEKLAFLRELDVLSVPATYDEPKGMFLLEAMASGVPVVQPRRGAFTEIVEKTGGGLLVAPDDAESLADGLYRLWRDRSLAKSIGQRGFHGVRTHYTLARSADRLLEVYHGLGDSGLAARDASGPAQTVSAGAGDR